MAVFDDQPIKRPLAHLGIGAARHHRMAHRPGAIARDINFAPQYAFGGKALGAAAAYRAFGHAIDHDIGDGAIAHVNARMLHRHPQIAIQHTAGHRYHFVAEGVIDKIFQRFETQWQTGLEGLQSGKQWNNHELSSEPDIGADLLGEQVGGVGLCWGCGCAAGICPHADLAQNGVILFVIPHPDGVKVPAQGVLEIALFK